MRAIIFARDTRASEKLTPWMPRWWTAHGMDATEAAAWSLCEQERCDESKNTNYHGNITTRELSHSKGVGKIVVSTIASV